MWVKNFSYKDHFLTIYSSFEDPMVRTKQAARLSGMRVPFRKIPITKIPYQMCFIRLTRNLRDHLTYEMYCINCNK